VTWDVLTCHEMGFDAEVGHADLWPSVIERLAKACVRDARILRRLLKDRCYGLPRGRVTRLAGKPGGSWPVPSPMLLDLLSFPPRSAV
jgi:hypothetical protein